ncbi:2911_t:CDS:2, partial [Funneliformis geosporum]
MHLPTTEWPNDTYREFMKIITEYQLLNSYGKTSEHLIYISLENISNWSRNKPHAKVLIGYLLKLKAKNNTTRNSKVFQKLQRQ